MGTSQEKILTGNLSQIWSDIQNKRIPFLILLISCCLLYVNTLKHDYALDDQLAIYENKFVTQGISGIGDIMTHDAFEGFFGERGSKLISGGRYRPLSFVSFAIEWEIFGNNPHISHAINLLLYGLLCCAIFYFLSFLFASDEVEKRPHDFLYSLPFLASILYCYHPIHTEVVANIKGRDELMCFLFAVLSLIYYFRFFNEKKWTSYVTLFILFSSALLSKENAITFLAIFPLVTYIRGGKLKEIWNRSFLTIIAATVFFLFLRFKFTAVGVTDQTTEILNNPFVRATGAEKYATIIYSFLKYFLLLIFPHPLTHDYYFNQIPYKKFSDPMVLISLLSILAISIYLSNNWKKKTPFIFGVFFFFMTFSIFSNLLFTVGIIMNERFVFISSLGFSILSALLLQKVEIRFGKIAFYIVLIGVVSLYGFKTVMRNLDWKNNKTLFSSDYVTSHNSAKVSTSLGGQLYEEALKILDTAAKRKQLDTSIVILKHAIKIYPENSQTWLLYANAIYARTGNYRDAIDIYKKCNELRGNNFFDASYNMAVLYYNAAQYDSSLIHAQLAVQIQPDHKEAKSVLSRVLAKLGRTQEAIASGGIDNSNLSSLALDAKDGGNYNEALSLAEQALTIDSDDATANYVKGICLARFMNKIPEGIPYLEKAIAVNSENPNWMEDLAVAYGMTGRVKEAVPILEKALNLKPSAAIYQNLATSYLKLGNPSKAQYYMNLSKQAKQ